MSTLYEIRADIENLTREMVDPETGEIDEEKMAELEQLELDHEQKIENILLLAKNCVSDARQHEEESKVQKEKADRLKRKAARLLEYVSGDLDGKDFTTPKVEVAWRKSKSVEILNEDLIPDEYKQYETTCKVSKTLIKKAIDKEEKEVPGARLLIKNNMRVI